MKLILDLDTGIDDAMALAYAVGSPPLAFYAAYFSIRAKAFDEAYMCRGMDVCQKKMREIIAKDKEASAVEQDMLTTLEVCYEFYLRAKQPRFTTFPAKQFKN